MMTAMTNRIGRAMGLLALVSMMLGTTACATSTGESDEALPRHPFPRWVSRLESGRSEIDEVAAIFGDPVEIQESTRGGATWRYLTREIHWAPNDPERPEVAADGTRTPRVPTWQKQVRVSLRATTDFLGGLLLYPAPRPRGAEQRSLPATIHELELVFGPDGTLRRYHYAPRAALVKVPTGG